MAWALYRLCHSKQEGSKVLDEERLNKLLEISDQVTAIQRQMAEIQAELHMLRLIYQLLETS